MNILLTNDDGITSERLLYLESVLKEYGDVYVVAPMFEQSAKSASLTIGEIKFEKYSEFKYAIYGTPVDCVTFGVHGLKIDFDLVVSGVNKGFNLGIDILYSGTLGACFQAQYFNIKSLAFSGDYKGYTIVKKELSKTIKYVFDKDLLSDNHTININFPMEKFEVSKGIVEVKRYLRRYNVKGEIIENVFIRKRDYNTVKAPEGTDAFAHDNGFTSITKVTI